MCVCVRTKKNPLFTLVEKEGGEAPTRGAFKVCTLWCSHNNDFAPVLYRKDTPSGNNDALTTTKKKQPATTHKQCLTARRVRDCLASFFLSKSIKSITVKRLDSVFVKNSNFLIFENSYKIEVLVNFGLFSDLFREDSQILHK